MARQITWIERLPQIRKSVRNSVRSHYERADLELLFTIQSSAAGKLLGMLPTTKVGPSKLVTREDLAAFLDRVNEAGDVDDVAALCRRMREERQPSSRRKLRTLRKSDFAEVTIASLPDAIALEAGRVEIRFETLDRLVECLAMLAVCLESATGLDELAKICEPQRGRDEQRERELADARRIDDELRAMMARIHAKRAEAAADFSGQVVGR